MHRSEARVSPSWTGTPILAALWLVVPATALLLLADIGDPAGETARYLATWLLSVVLPGTLLWRALAGGRSVAQDLGFGAVLGVAWELTAWAVCTAIGLPQLQWVAVAGLVLTFVLVPSLRQHLRFRGTSPAPPTWWHLVMVAALLLAMIRTFAWSLRLMPLPPVAFARQQDIYYQLGLVEVLRHDVTPADPSVLGDPLIYHWFPNASMASQSVMSGIGAPQVLLHQWPLTLVLTLVLTGWAAGEALSERSWAGPVAGALAGVLPGNLQLPAMPRVDMSIAQVLQGPGGGLAAAVMVALVGPTVLILRRQATRGVWVAMAVLLALSSGVKPTLLPIMLAGCAVAGLSVWFTERRLPWRLVALGALTGGFFLVASFALVGSTGGSRIQFLAALRVQPFYQAITGDKSYPASGGWVLPSLASGDARMLLFAAMLVAWYLLIDGPRLLALLGTTVLPARADPAYWWAGGCIAAGTCITLVFSHTGYSEYHFLRTVATLGSVTAVAVAARILGDEIRHRRVWGPLTLAAAAGFVTAWLIRWLWPDGRIVTTLGDVFVALLMPFLLLALVGTAVVLAVRLVVSPRRWSTGLVVHSMVFVVAASLPAQLSVLTHSVYAAATHEPVMVDQTSRFYLTEDEQQAALWLHDNAAVTDVVVSNVFCMPTRYKPGCPDDAFWISGLSGTQQYLGGWAYTAENLERTNHKTSFLLQPPPWPDRLRDSLDAVERPTPQLLARLAGTSGVDWIVADRRAGPVSPALDRLADLRFSNDDVRIYRLR